MIVLAGFDPVMAGHSRSKNGVASLPAVRKRRAMPTTPWIDASSAHRTGARMSYAACLSALFSFSSLAFDSEVLSTRGLNGSSSARTLSSVISFT